MCNRFIKCFYFYITTQNTLKYICKRTNNEFHQIFKSIAMICNTPEIAIFVLRISGQ